MSKTQKRSLEDANNLLRDISGLMGLVTNNTADSANAGALDPKILAPSAEAIDERYHIQSTHP